jgi:hypothetical protein
MTPELGYRDFFCPGQILAGQRTGTGADIAGRSVRHQMAAEASRARPEVDHVVGAADGLFIVLDYQHGVAEIAEPAQRVQ